MRLRKNHIIPVSLIVLLSFPVLLFLYLHISQKFVQHEMLEKLEHEQLQTVTLHCKAVQWYKKEKEIILNATLFDVHSYSIKGDSITFLGLFDKKETELKAQVRKLLERSERDQATRELVIAKMISQLWVTDSAELNVACFNASSKRKHFSYPTMLASKEISTLTPPPEVRLEL